MRFDDRQTRAFRDLRHSPVFEALCAEYEAARDSLVTLTDTDHLRIAQGRAKVLRELLTAIDPDGFSTSGKRQ